jgi:hypothetical protein
MVAPILPASRQGAEPGSATVQPAGADTITPNASAGFELVFEIK